jgi:hypothetical protein
LISYATPVHGLCGAVKDDRRTDIARHADARFGNAIHVELHPSNLGRNLRPSTQRTEQQGKGS